MKIIKMKYLDEVYKGVKLLSEDPRVIFVGQALKYPGHAITHQVKDLGCQKIEMPVAEDFQAGFCIGMALEGYIPVCIYPRFNFALLATNQIVNHLDKYPLITDGKVVPKVIIKVAVGSDTPLDPGHQHKYNFTEAFRSMCKTIEVIELTKPFQVFDSYKYALQSKYSVILVEHSANYADEEEWEW